MKIYDSVLRLVPALSTHCVQVFQRACRAAKQGCAESGFTVLQGRVLSLNVERCLHCYASGLS